MTVSLDNKLDLLSLRSPKLETKEVNDMKFFECNLLPFRQKT